ncbi:type III polyketide synthase [Streptomyces sp. NPDC088197]|uniref:type III polyketide synthase n=1 Tax=unclassified Streptomyces TaxID=2593676 RepID=UPI00381007A9
MSVYMWPPAVVPGPYTITTEEILAEVNGRHPGASWLKRADGMAKNTGIGERRWMQPLEAITAPSRSGFPGPAASAAGETGETGKTAEAGPPVPQTVEERTASVWVTVQDCAERAARQALETAGVTPDQVDYVVTSNSTTPALPGLDIALFNRLGLREDVLLLPFSQWACIAGTRSLATASKLLAADPGATVLIVIAEALSTTYQPDDTGIDSLLMRLLFADTAVAAVVRGRPDQGAFLRLDAAWHRTVPGTADIHRLHTRADGVHYEMDRSGPKWVQSTLPPMWEWVRGRHTDPDWHPDLLVAHPGGTRVLELIQESVPSSWPDVPGPWPDHLLDHSWSSIVTGNRGGAAVFDVLDRALSAGVPAGARTVLYGAAPGLTATAMDGVWL